MRTAVSRAVFINMRFIDAPLEVIPGADSYAQEIAVHGFFRIGKPLGKPPPVHIQSEGPVGIKAPVYCSGGFQHESEISLI